MNIRFIRFTIIYIRFILRICIKIFLYSKNVQIFSVQYKNIFKNHFNHIILRVGDVSAEITNVKQFQWEIMGYATIFLYYKRKRNKVYNTEPFDYV